MEIIVDILEMAGLAVLVLVIGGVALRHALRSRTGRRDVGTDRD